MKKITLLLILIPLLGISQDYEIGNWYNFKKGAVCLTFDDGLPDHPDNVIPALNSRSMPGTFFVNNMGNYSWAINAISQGHEIANHTPNHPHLLTLNANGLNFQISNFNGVLESALGNPVNTFAYPYGEGGENTPSEYYVQDTVASKHIGGRSVAFPYTDSSYIYDFAPTDRAYYQVKTVHMSNNMVGYDSTFQKVVEYGGLMTYMFHYVGTPGGFDNIGLTQFDDFLDTLEGYGSDIWVSTFEDAIMYHRERKGAVLSTISAPFAIGNTWVLELTDTLDDNVYDHELSIKLDIPSPITAVIAAYQDGNAIPFQIVNDSILFNAVPDAGDISFDILNCVQPTNGLTITGSTTFCTPDSVLFEADYNANYSYTWYKDEIPFGVDTNKIYIKESGEFYAEINLSGCPNYTAKTEVLVTGVCGVPETDFEANVLFEFLNEELIFTSTSSNLQGGETFYWDFGVDASLVPGLYGPGPINVSYSTSGLKTVSLTATGSVGADVETKVNYVEVASIEKCGIFNEDFNEDFKWDFVGCYCDYSASIVNEAFRITTSDTIANEWYWAGWWFNDDSLLTPIDFSDPVYTPVLRIRAKASDTCRLAFSLADTANYSTAGFTMNQKGYIDVTTEYQEFELNFSNLFFNEWTNPVTQVDSTQISFLKMTIDGGFKSFPFTNSYGQYVNKQFEGFVDIDWISIGEKCEFDSLFANIVLPDTICMHQTINVWNHSNPSLVGAQFDWEFDEGSSVPDTTASDELPISLKYSTLGNKTVNLKITTQSGKIIEISETVYVKKCDVGISENGNQLSMSFVNPVQESISGVVTSLKEEDVSIVITDVSGKLILNERTKFQSGENNVNFSNIDLPAGAYILTIYTLTSKQHVNLVSIGK